MNDRGNLSENTIRWIFQQLLIALDYIHKAGVVNRDVKLENILLMVSERLLIKICDFGFSKHDGRDSNPHTQLGTLQFTALEVLFMAVPHSQTYCGQKADIWSAGVVLYTLMTSQHLYDNVNWNQAVHLETISQKLQQLRDGVGVAHISLEGRQFLQSILVFNPAYRPTIAQLQEHPWYRRGLPPHALSFNTHIALQHQQCEAEIKRLVAEARKLPN